MPETPTRVDRFQVLTGAKPLDIVEITGTKPPTPSSVSLSARSVRVVQDPCNTTPDGFPLDIVEIELYPLNEGNGEWMQWRDLIRFSCARGRADSLLAALGLKPGQQS